MKTLSILLAVIACMFQLQSCTAQSVKTIKGSKNYVTKQIKVSDFQQVRLSGSANLIYTQKAGKPSVEVYTSDNIAEILDIRVKDGTLLVGFKKGYNRISYDKLEVRVSSEHLHGVSLTGSGNINLTNGLQTTSLSLSISGSGNIRCDNLTCSGDLSCSLAGSGNIRGKKGTCSNLDVSIAGSGNVELKETTASYAKVSIAGSGNATLTGTADKGAYKVSGSGDIHASGFQINTLEANISGSGDIECHVTEYLNARTAGSGRIGYKGNPTIEAPKKGAFYIIK